MLKRLRVNMPANIIKLKDIYCQLCGKQEGENMYMVHDDTGKLILCEESLQIYLSNHKEVTK